MKCFHRRTYNKHIKDNLKFRTPELPSEDLNVRQLRWRQIKLPSIEPLKKRGTKRARAAADQLEGEGSEPSRKRSKSVKEEPPINMSTPSPLSSAQGASDIGSKRRRHICERSLSKLLAALRYFGAEM